MAYPVPYHFHFADAKHKDSFTAAVKDIGIPAPDVILPLFLLTATSETRTRVAELVDLDGVLRDDPRDEWQTEDARRCVALAANLTRGACSPILSPSYLYDTPLAPVLRSAVNYWYLIHTA